MQITKSLVWLRRDHDLSIIYKNTGSTIHQPADNRPIRIMIKGILWITIFIKAIPIFR